MTDAIHQPPRTDSGHAEVVTNCVFDEVTEDTARLHHDAIAAGWSHSYDLTPDENLRALVESVDADRRGHERVAFRFISGYGPGSTPLALERLGVTI